MLWDDVLPRLRSRVQSLELDVHLVDIQHLCGLSPAEHHLDGHAHLRHLDMIIDCHRMSCGPFFLVSNFRLVLCNTAAVSAAAAANYDDGKARRIGRRNRTEMAFVDNNCL